MDFIEDELDKRILHIIMDGVEIGRVLKIFYKNLFLLKKAKTVEEARQLFYELELKRMKAYGLRLLSKSNYHSSVFKKKLEEKLVSKKVLSEILKEFSKYFDDEYWLEKKIKEEFAKGFGPKAIIFKLRSKNIFLEDIKIISDDMQREKINEILNKRFAGKMDKKSASFFIRRGFDYSLVISI